MSSSLFPHFRQRFLQETTWAKDTAIKQQSGTLDNSKEPVVKMAGRGAAPKGLVFAKPLMLDLDALQPARDDPSLDADQMLQQKRDKLAAFDKQCSRVADGLFVSGKAVAEDRQILADNNITHIVNCVGALYPEYFKNDGILYKTLWLQDVPQEDILCILYDTFDFIEAARRGSVSSTACSSCSTPFASQQQQQQQQPLSQPQPQQHSSRMPGTAGGGRVLVHCSQGVSRSTTIAIAYLMWKTGGSYEEVYQTVRALRGVTSPNIGFMCQLMNWAKRRQRPPSRARVYQIVPHNADDPTYLVPKAVNARPGCSYPDWSTLDPRGCFVVHLPDKLYVWRGSSCLSSMAEAGMRAASALMRYEDTPAAELVRQGDEPEDLIVALNPSNSIPPGSAMMSVEPSSSNLSMLGAPAAAAAVGAGPCTAAEDEEMQPVSAPGIRPASALQQQQQQQEPPPPGHSQHQLRQPPPWASPAASARPSSAASTASQSSRPVSATAPGWAIQQQQQRQGSLSSAPSDSATQLSGQLSSPQLAGGLQAVVAEVANYNTDYELWLRAVLKNGGTSSTEAGRLTPRSSLASLVVDDLNASSSRSESPASVEGRNRKYRRSESESLRVVPSFRQPGRLSASSNPSLSLWPIGSPSGAAAAAAAGQIGAPLAAAGATMGTDSGELSAAPAVAAAGKTATKEEDKVEATDAEQYMGGCEAAQGHIKRMSIDADD